MIQELLYTSHEGRGLRQGGGGGYCTVLSTEGMASNLAASLEKLSGYKHPFDIHDPRSGQNPINWRHAVIRVGGVAYHVLSRIADLKGEHTGRSNKLAHHVVLAQADQVPGGPTRLLMHPGFSRTSWDGKVELVHAVPRSSLPNDDLPPRVCRHWQAAGGDAGLAGHVADLLRSVPNPTVSVIFPLGANALALVDEVFSLLTPQQRWSTTFSTYYAAAPPISSCHLRFVLDGTADADLLRRDHRQLVVDLANPPSQLAESPLVTAARTGVRPARQPDALRPHQTALQSNRENSPGADAAPAASQLPALEPLPGPLDETSFAQLHSEGRAGGRLPSSSPQHYRANRRSPTAQKQKSREKWALVACCLIALGLCIGGVVAFFLFGGGGETPAVAKADPQGETLEVEKPAAPTTATHTVDDMSSNKPSDSPPANEAAAEGQRPPEAKDAGAGNAAVAEDDARASLAGGASTEAVGNEQAPVTPADPPIVLLEGPRIAMLSDVVSNAKPLPTKAEVGEAEPIRDEIEAFSLLGLDWTRDKWQKLSGKQSLTDKEVPELLSPTNDSREWKVMFPSPGRPLGGPTEFLCCVFREVDGKIHFEWKTDTGKQINGGPSKTAILNGLKWCVLRIATKNGPRLYFRLADPRRPVECSLFDSGPQPLLDTSLALNAKASVPRVDLTIESHPLVITKHLDSTGTIEFKYPAEEGSDYIRFKVALKDSADKATELSCDHKLSYQVLIADGNRVKAITQDSPDIAAAVQRMQDLRNERDRQIQSLDDETKGLAVNTDEWKKKEKRLALLRSHRQQLDDRIPVLKSFDQAYAALKAQTATVTLDIIYTDDNQEIPVPVLSKDAPMGPSS